MAFSSVSLLCFDDSAVSAHKKTGLKPAFLCFVHYCLLSSVSHANDNLNVLLYRAVRQRRQTADADRGVINVG